MNFARLLAEKNRVANAADVHREFERLIAEEERVLEPSAATASRASATTRPRRSSARSSAAGRKVEATRDVDPSLIGGLVVQAGPSAWTRVCADVRSNCAKN